MEDLINKYFEKSLTAKELEEFEKKLKTDSLFKEEFEFQKSVHAAIHEKERAELKKLVAGFEKPKQQSNWWKFAAAAVVVIVGGWVVFQQFLSKPDPSDLYLSYYQTYPNVIAPNVRGENQESLKTKAFAAYDNGEYDISAKLFEELKTQINEVFPAFYEGISYLELNQPEKTISLFENKRFDDTDLSFEGYRQWYLALAYLKKNEMAKAKEILTTISKSEDIQKEQAAKLLDEL